MTEQKKATIAWISVTEVSITARTAAVRTGSGIRPRPFLSSTHNCRTGRASCSIALSLPTTDVFRVAARLEPLYADTTPPVQNDARGREKVSPGSPSGRRPQDRNE
ncbi:hypothetical protein GCM10019017_66880 [Streptomyces showdoensis]